MRSLVVCQRDSSTGSEEARGVAVYRSCGHGAQRRYARTKPATKVAMSMSLSLSLNPHPFKTKKGPHPRAVATSVSRPGIYFQR